MLDGTIGSAIQNRWRINVAIAKSEVLYFCPLMIMLQPFTFIYIDRPKKNAEGKVDNTSAMQTMKRFNQEIKNKLIGWMTPEGTRNKNFLETPILPLKKGFL